MGWWIYVEDDGLFGYKLLETKCPRRYGFGHWIRMVVPACGRFIPTPKPHHQARNHFVQGMERFFGRREPDYNIDIRTLKTGRTLEIEGIANRADMAVNERTCTNNDN